MATTISCGKTAVQCLLLSSACCCPVPAAVQCLLLSSACCCLAEYLFCYSQPQSLPSRRYAFMHQDEGAMRDYLSGRLSSFGPCVNGKLGARTFSDAFEVS